MEREEGPPILEGFLGFCLQYTVVYHGNIL